MNTKEKTLKQKRLEQLFQECQDTVISQTLSALGLCKGMFTDRDGGNVTTLKNFKREDNSYVHERDHASYEQANKKFERSDYTLTDNAWNEKKTKHREDGIDKYTGKPFRDPTRVDLDHVTTVKEIHSNDKLHLACNTGTDSGIEKLKNIVNNDKNLVSTDASINRSKGKKTNSEFLESTPIERKKELGVNDELMKKEEKKSQKYIESQGNKELLKKQTKEILSSGGEQAIDMGVKQAFSSLMIEVINITFNEVKIIVRNENILDKKSLKQFNNRIKRNIRAFICKVPDILKDSIKGGISGFLSNLFTFIINNFISTAKKIVTMIREGFRAIYRVFKMIFFPPEGMSKTEIWANAIKLLSTTLITTFALTFTDTIAAFLTVNLPILTPIADVIASVFIGIISGLASALISYLIDSLLDKFIDRHDEQMMDMLLEQSEIREKLVTDLITFINTSEKSVQVYTHIIQRNQLICQNFATIENNNTVIHSGISQSVKKIQKVTEQTKSQITKSIETVNSIESSQIDIEIFLANY